MLGKIYFGVDSFQWMFGFIVELYFFYYVGFVYDFFDFIFDDVNFELFYVLFLFGIYCCGVIGKKCELVCLVLDECV